MSSPAPFDWKSLITPAVALGSKAIGDAVAPAPNLMDAQTAKQNAQFNQTLALQKMAQANKIRGQMMPGMYTSLGYSPAQGRQMATDYSTTAGSPTPSAASSFGGTLGAKAPSSGGSPVGKAILGAGIGMAPAIAGALIHPAAAAAGGAAATGGGLGATIAGLATNPITLIGAGALAAGLIWKKSQAHPTADKWVQGEQAPFDSHWQQLDKMGLPPDQLQQAKTQSAQEYLNALVQFHAGGGHNEEVAANAARTFRQYYGDPSQYGVQVPF